MKRGERGIAPIIILGVAALLVIGGAFLYANHTPGNPPFTFTQDTPEEQEESSAEMQNIASPPAQEPVAPARETKPAVATKPSAKQPASQVRDEGVATDAESATSWIDSWMGAQQSASSPAFERPGWEVLSEREKAQLPECKSVLMTVSPVPLTSITGIEPIGSANPPEHTLASISSDTYIAVGRQGTTAMTPLVAPGDMWIIEIVPRYGVTQDPEDHVIKYAFCKDVYGVVDHVKSFSPEMKKIVDAYQCPRAGNKPGDNDCPVLVLEPVKAGTPLGMVGRMQGNFNFGTWDLRVAHFFISPSRHGFLTKHSTCPFDYFASPLREQLLSKLEPTALGSCGSVEHDVAGTLSGDWFIGDASPTRHADWGKLLHFGSSNRLAGQSVISASGIFVTEPTKWIFSATALGYVNRKFADVVPGAIYCYDNDGNHPQRNYERGVLSGRILVELTSTTELQVEHQTGMCGSGGWAFIDSTRYQR